MRLHSIEAQSFRLTQILRLSEEGVRGKQIAHLPDGSEAWVSQVLKRCREQGKENVHPKGPAAGHPPALKEEQLADLQQVLTAEAKASGFETDGWTCKRIARVIKERYGVEHHPAHISRLLTHQLGFSLQKPARKDYRRKEAELQQWKEELLPALKKSPGRTLPDLLCG